MRIPLLLLAAIVGAVAVWYFRRRPRPRWVSDEELPRPNHGGIFLTTSTENDARVAKALPTRPSEDVSHLLGHIDLPPESPDEPRDYLPEPAIDWVVSASFPDRATLPLEKIKAVFSPG